MSEPVDQVVEADALHVAGALGQHLARGLRPPGVQQFARVLILDRFPEALRVQDVHPSECGVAIVDVTCDTWIICDTCCRNTTSSTTAAIPSSEASVTLNRGTNPASPYEPTARRTSIEYMNVPT